MGRSDVGRLKLPENQQLPQQEPDEPQDVHDQAAAAEKDKAVTKPKLEVCPHCGTRLSPLDLKMNKCFRCWALLDDDGSGKPSPGRASFEVHI